MNSIMALFRGYFRFDVNGRRFYRFARAAEEAHMLCRMRLAVTFRGWNVCLWALGRKGGWAVFLIREHPGPAIYDLTKGAWLEDGDPA